jgi:hypothetical protein
MSRPRWPCEPPPNKELTDWALLYNSCLSSLIVAGVGCSCGSNGVRGSLGSAKLFAMVMIDESLGWRYGWFDMWGSIATACCCRWWCWCWFDMWRGALLETTACCCRSRVASCCWSCCWWWRSGSDRWLDRCWWRGALFGLGGAVRCYAATVSLLCCVACGGAVRCYAATVSLLCCVAW